MKTAILQPLVPHYRESFFKKFQLEFPTDIYVYESKEKISQKGMEKSDLNLIYLKSKTFMNKAIFYDFRPFLQQKYDIIILPGELRSMSTWILLFLFKFTKKKVILWGHGISIHNYLKEEKNLSPIRIFFHKLADQVWLYTEKEKKIWSNYIDPDTLIALNNTIDTEEIFNQTILDKNPLLRKYKIKTKLNLIFCARFTANRRIDLLLALLDKLDSSLYGLIVIGSGEYKPDFSSYENVYDFGAIYDRKIKSELFAIADIYFQPAWTGLSVVEAMAYGKPIITFKRSENILQSVEYGYIEDGTNGYIGDSIEDVLDFIQKLSESQLNRLKETTRTFAKKVFGVQNMIGNAKSGLRKLSNEY